MHHIVSSRVSPPPRRNWEKWHYASPFHYFYLTLNSLSSPWLCSQFSCVFLIWYLLCTIGIFKGGGGGGVCVFICGEGAANASPIMMKRKQTRQGCTLKSVFRKLNLHYCLITDDTLWDVIKVLTYMQPQKPDLTISHNIPRYLTYLSDQARYFQIWFLGIYWDITKRD